MGYAMELFVDQEVDEEFICTICHEVMMDPVMSKSCQHIFCSSCLNVWRRTSNTCPIDRKPITARKLSPPFRVYMNMYERLRLKCNFTGCSVITTIGQLESHVNSCTFNPAAVLPCVHDCGASLPIKDIPLHNCMVYLKAELLNKDKAHELEKKELTKENEELKKQIKQKDKEIRKLSTARVRLGRSPPPPPFVDSSSDDDDDDDDDSDFDMIDNNGNGPPPDDPAPGPSSSSSSNTVAESIAEVLRRNTTIDYGDDRNSGTPRATKITSLTLGGGGSRRIPRNFATKVRESPLSGPGRGRRRPRQTATKAAQPVYMYCRQPNN